jgi:acyl carrier protein
MRVRALWKDLLGFEQIETDADFLELGGHSLLAMQLAGRVRQAFGVMVSAGEVISSTNTTNRMVEHLKRLGAK